MPGNCRGIQECHPQIAPVMKVRKRMVGGAPQTSRQWRDSGKSASWIRPPRISEAAMRKHPALVRSLPAYHSLFPVLLIYEFVFSACV